MTLIIFVLLVAYQLPISASSVLDAEITEEQLRQVFGPTRTIEVKVDQLDVKLTKRLASSSRYNFILSPLGLKLALGTLAEASTGVTQTELLWILGSDLDQQRKKYTNITSSLEKYNQTTNLQSWIFLTEDIVPRQRIVRVAEIRYYTKLKTFDARDPYEAARQMNIMVQNSAGSEITDTFNEQDIANTAVLVINTFMLKSGWEKYFLLSETRNDQFFVSPSIVKNVPFMRMNDHVAYAESNNLDAKIFGKHFLEKTKIYFIVPNSLTGHSRLLKNLSLLETELQKVEKDEYSYVHFILPKFKMVYTAELTGIMKDLGVKKIFEDSASLPGLGRNVLPLEPIKISRLVQRFDFGIHEFGTSSGRIGTPTRGGEPSPGSKEVVVNRPFLFILFDLSSEQILLIGRITDPTNSLTYFESV